MTTPRYLLDTNVLIAMRSVLKNQRSRDPNHQLRLDRIRDRCKTIPCDQMAMSFVTLGELVCWAEKSADAAKAHALLDRLKAMVHVDTGIPAGQAHGFAQRYGEVRAHLEKAGQKMGTNDNWIAAHALALDMTVVTHDQAFSRVPHLRCEDWTA